MLAFMSIAVGTGVGASSLIARRLGAGDKQGADYAAGVTITLTLIIGGLMTAIVLPNMDGLLRLLGANDPAVLDLARRYLSILTIFAFTNSFFLIATTIIRAEGSPTFPSVVIVIGAIANIILDPIMIYALDMGIAGAAYATVIARSIGSALLVWYFVFGKTTFKFKPGYFIPKPKILLEIYRTGLASMVQMSAASIILMLANWIAIGYSEIHLAVMGTLFRLSSFAFMPSIGLSQGVLPLIGYNYGAQLKDRVGEVIVKAGKAALILGVGCALAALVIPTQLMSLFNSDPEFLALGTTATRIFAIGFLSVGLQNVLGSLFQGLGKGTAALVVASSRQIIFLLPAILILPKIWGETGLWISFPLANTLAIIMTLVWTAYEFRHLHIKFHLRYPHIKA
jgi:putative MATE family efflux protein